MVSMKNDIRTRKAQAENNAKKVDKNNTNKKSDVSKKISVKSIREGAMVVFSSKAEDDD